MDIDQNSSTQMFDITQAQLIRRDYVCAACWGPLNSYAVKGSRLMKIACPNCGDDRGLVTKAFADRRRSQSVEDYWDARTNLAAILPASKEPKKTEEQILGELGF